MAVADTDCGPIHARLRLATRHVHARIEQAMPFGAANFGVDAYRDLLAAMHGFYRPLEGALAAQAAAMPELQWRQRIKLPWLALDLRSLGMTGAQIERLPRCDRLPDLAAGAPALGCLYVLEGSTLGGQVLQRLVSRRLGAPAARAVTFFRSYGAEVEARWRSFLACLERLDDGQAAAAEHAALDTFHTLEAWLRQREVLR